MKEQIRKSIIFLAAFGILLASYLFYNFVFQPQYRLCTINASVNCDAVISGSVSKTLGIPTALYGLVGYIVILFGAIKNKFKLVLGMALFGTLFCLRLMFIEVVLLKALCPVCLICQLVMIGVLMLAILMKRL